MAKRKNYFYVVMDAAKQKPIFESATLPIYYSRTTARKVRNDWSNTYLARITEEQVIGLIKTFGIATK